MFSASIFDAYTDPHEDPAGAQQADDTVKEMMWLGFSGYLNKIISHPYSTRSADGEFEIVGTDDWSVNKPCIWSSDQPPI